MIIEQNVLVRMRDGVALAVDVYRPEAAGHYPVLLTRVPYNKDLRAPWAPDRRIYLELSLDVERTVAAGYVVVAQDTRGRFASEGVFRPTADEGGDGADTIAWAAAQPWSSGQVGMFGESYQGLTQWLAAREQPAALRTIVPMHAPFAATTMYTFAGGAFQPATFLWWALTQGARPELERRIAQGHGDPARLAALIAAEQQLSATFDHLPLADQPLLEGLAPYFFEWVGNPEAQAAQHAAAQRELYPGVTVPALLIGGWYDYFLPATLSNYRGLRDTGGSAQARRPHLLIGPWAHVDFPGMFAERDYGPESSTRAVGLPQLHLRWFDRWLKGVDTGIDRELPVRIFVMGLDQWRAEADWPLPDTQYRPYFLQSAGRANSAAGDGMLSSAPPTANATDTFTYDPRRPVPTVGGAIMLMEASGAINAGPRDQRAVEARADVLCYTTPPLSAPLEVTGPVVLRLFVSSSAPDTDITAKLVDVYPDGRAEILTSGILRLRYRDSLVRPALLEPGTVYELDVDVGATANVFRTGHRVRLEVSSSNFPHYDRNPNTGGQVSTARAADMVVAENTVHHSPAYPSALILPIIEREPSAAPPPPAGTPAAGS